ncbi:hypothetical protein R3W88_033627 [Solanum pinnatisectum]|uniref:Uncharacterized protein n=1 Tax=Solanum pinnatisectum TaxID=50273 RepID=A0AAV9K0I0_9SOLN|nr:hypothetical protein R3W88_033627 [Solanum pinnatisectum]
MASETNLNYQEMSSEIEEEEYYDKRSFLSAKCAHKYDEYLEEAIPDFHGRLVTFGWMCFAIKSITVNHTLFCLSIICALVVPLTCNTKVMLDMIVLIVTIMDGMGIYYGPSTIRHISSQIHEVRDLMIMSNEYLSRGQGKIEQG